ncbi:hypothetical protein PR202_ga27202 [Eleusine coracana subsp. coracana]|uniref:Uncharacterized protein n=1 Tax=Eleusine coracana subsp. coracana TaxID=191504 RepID=A0AAV5DG56_ELECO|nr:hypothetical protein PR202_ga27202 [Eleusine coracana subsp. coracana]
MSICSTPVASKMKFWSLLVVAWLPVLQVLLVGLFGALLASSRFNILTSNARTNINKIVYVVFVPSLVFSSLASTVTLKDIISWWFMPVNMGIVFSIGAVLGWIAVKAFRPGEHLQGLVIACNWGTIPLMIIPANCNEEDNPFGDANTCNSLGLSYVSLSMALGNFYIWTHSYSIMKRSAELYKEMFKYSTPIYTVKEERSGRDTDNSYVAFLPLTSENRYENVRSNLKNKGFVGGGSERAVVTTKCSCDKMKSLVTEEGSPLWVIQDSAKLLGNAAIPCTVLILGGNLTKGIGRTLIKPLVVLSIIVIRFIVLPACGIGIVAAADKLGFLPRSPLYRYVLLLQSTVPPAMSIGTIAQLFDVGEEECSIIFLWTHLVAALALTLWSTVFMSLVL